MILKMMISDEENYSLRTITDVKETIQTRSGKGEQLEVIYKDGSAERIITSEKTEDGAYQNLYNWIYLMNENGKTIEKII